MPRALVGSVLALTSAVLVAGCSGPSSDPTPSSSASTSSPTGTHSVPSGSSRPTTSHSSVSSEPTATSSSSSSVSGTTGAQAALSRLSLAERVGQLFMVGGPATGMGEATASAVTGRHIGNVMLTGRSSAGVTATRHVVGQVSGLVSTASTGGVPLFVATDQEGGFVQVLRGAGFSTIPTGLSQGGWSSRLLEDSAARWGRELHAAGVNLDLAPVADTVPSAAAARTNPPIGQFRREFGYTTARVSVHAAAFSRGLASAGVDSAAKHFPGLGRVTGNTDTTSGVTDRVTTVDDAYLAPFRATIQAHSAFVMMSTAVYARIDPARPAAFSPTVVGIVRRLGFGGVVISDDLGSARQVARWSPGQRAVLFLRAGGDMVLTVDPAVLPAMYDAALAEARRDSGFRARVNASALRVLQAKASLGLLH